MVFLAHTRKDRLLGTTVHTTQLLFCAMGNASSALDGNLRAAFSVTFFTGRSMGTAESGFFYIFGAAWVTAMFSFGAMVNTKAALDNTIQASFDIALAANALAGSTRCKLAPPVILTLI